MVDLMQRCWSDPTKRPTMREVAEQLAQCKWTRAPEQVQRRALAQHHRPWSMQEQRRSQMKDEGREQPRIATSIFKFFMILYSTVSVCVFCVRVSLGRDFSFDFAVGLVRAVWGGFLGGIWAGILVGLRAQRKPRMQFLFLCGWY